MTTQHLPFCILPSVFCIALLSVTANATERFVSKGNAGAAAPYDTPATAAAEIQAAIDASSAGDVITVAASASTYSPFTVSKGVTVRGATGNWKDVIVDAAQSKTAVTISHADAVVASLTAKQGQPRCFDNTGGGTITNCHATLGNPKNTQNGKGFGIYNNNGKVLDTVIDGCRSSDHYSGLGYTQEGANALGDRLVVTNNTAGRTYGNWSGYYAGAVLITGGILRNSIVAKNDIKSFTLTPNPMASGVHATDGRVINCTIAANVCSSTLASGTGAYANGTGVFENCILSGNLKSSAAANWGGTAANFINCATTPTAGLPAGTVDIAETSWTFSFQPSLIPVTDLMDAGTIAGTAADCGDADFFGNPRLITGIPDIGHEEFQFEGNLFCAFTTVTNAGFIPFSGTLNGMAAGDLTGLTYYWDIDGDGVTDVSGADEASVDFSFPEGGVHDATLWVTNGAGDAATFTLRLTAMVRTHHYVSVDGSGKF